MTGTQTARLQAFEKMKHSKILAVLIVLLIPLIIFGQDLSADRNCLL
jgi:hypothetical protein